MGRRWLSAVVMLILISTGLARADSFRWPAHDDSPGPGGFATIVLESPSHGSRVKGPNLDIRLRTDNPKAAVRVKLDGKYVDQHGQPHVAHPDNPHDYPQWSFRESNDRVLLIPARGLAPGLHTLEVIRGAFGTELPNTNEQRVTFIVD